MFEVTTSFGPTRVEIDEPPGAVAMLALGHGAGGGFGAPDLVAACDAALGIGVAVARVTQPYRVAGRRTPAPAHQLDAAWLAAIEAVSTRFALSIRLPLFVGGRSSGARVACRTAAAAAAVGVVALAFPVHPPGRPDRSRLRELDTGRPTLVVAGERDPFGVPPEAPGREVVVVPGAVHDLRKNVRRVGEAVSGWLERQLGRTAVTNRANRR